MVAPDDTAADGAADEGAAEDVAGLGPCGRVVVTVGVGDVVRPWVRVGLGVGVGVGELVGTPTPADCRSDVQYPRTAVAPPAAEARSENRCSDAASGSDRSFEKYATHSLTRRFWLTGRPADEVEGGTGGDENGIGGLDCGAEEDTTGPAPPRCPDDDERPTGDDRDGSAGRDGLGS